MTQEPELVRREEAGSDTEARLRFLMETIPVQVWTARPDGSLDFVTEQTARFFGKSPEEVLGEGWLSVLHPDDVAHTVAAWTHSLGTGQLYEVEFRLRTGEGEDYRWFLARAVAFRGPTGEIERWYGSNTDIQAKKELEQALERASAAEQEAHRAQARLLKMLSHELRTPLGAIGGYVDLLAMEIKGPLNDDQRAQLERVRHNQQHLYRLINDLLELARLEARQFPVRIEPTAIADVVESAQAIVQPLLSEKALALEVDLDGACDVAVDPDRTRQILINLLGNAAKFTPAGGQVRVHCEVRDGRLAVAVIDSGRGVDPAARGAIFEPFARSGADESTEGTGLGLAISRELARAMDGDLRLAPTQPGRGAEFVLLLPLVGSA